VFQQTASSSSYTNYLGTNIALKIKSNGTQGTNGDAGNTITLTAVWTEVTANGAPALTLSSGSTTTITIRPPETTYIANTWGAITHTATTTGS
jgi:hypothetical protein